MAAKYTRTTFCTSTVISKINYYFQKKALVITREASKSSHAFSWKPESFPNNHFHGNIERNFQDTFYQTFSQHQAIWIIAHIWFFA